MLPVLDVRMDIYLTGVEITYPQGHDCDSVRTELQHITACLWIRRGGEYLDLRGL